MKANPETSADVPEPTLVAMGIDDNAVDRKLNERALQRCGRFRKIIQFAGGEEALGYLRSAEAEAVDVIFLDVNMPRMSGFEFLEAATAEFGKGFARSVVIMLTTSLNPRDKDRAAQFPVVRDYLSKPLTVEGANTVVHRLLDADT